MASLREIFSQIMEEQFEPLGDGELLSLDISREQNEVLAAVKFPELVQRGTLLAFERHVVQAMGLRASVCIPNIRRTSYVQNTFRNW